MSLKATREFEEWVKAGTSEEKKTLRSSEATGLKKESNIDNRIAEDDKYLLILKK